MSENLKLFLMSLLILQLILIINRVMKKKMTIKYASFWIILIIIMSFIVIFPNIIFELSKFAGFEEASNMVFLLGFFFLFYISFIITTSVSIQNEKIKTLIQEVSILKESVKKNSYRRRNKKI